MFSLLDVIYHSLIYLTKRDVCSGFSISIKCITPYIHILNKMPHMMPYTLHVTVKTRPLSSDTNFVTTQKHNAIVTGRSTNLGTRSLLLRQPPMMKKKKNMHWFIINPNQVQYNITIRMTSQVIT